MELRGQGLEISEEEAQLFCLSKQEEEILLLFSEEERNLVSYLLKEAKCAIYLDYKKAQAQLKPFMLYILRNLVNSNLNIGSARKAVNLTSNDYTRNFFKVTRMSPRNYLELHRLKLAQRLIQHTNAPIYRVSFAIGYSGLNMLSRNYKKVIGHLPSEEMKVIPPKRPDDVTVAPVLSVSDPKISTGADEIAADHVNPNMETFWRDVEHLDRSDIKTYLIKNIDTIDIHQSRFLLDKSKLTGRINLDRSEELARSALDALKLAEFWKEEEYLDDKAVIYANIANICRRRFNLNEAADWFHHAERLLPKDPREKPLIFAQVNLLKAVLLWWQRDVEASIDLIETIVPIIRRHGSHELLARALQVGGEVHECTGHSDRALPMFIEAVENTHYVNDPYVVFSAHYNLAYLYARLSRGAEAEVVLEKVIELQNNIQSTGTSFYVVLLRGTIFRANEDFKSAEPFFLEAREGFLSLGLDIYAALTSLELALLYLDLEKPQRASLLAASAIPSISQFCCHREVITALAVLQEAARLEVADRYSVEKALYHLELFRKDPTSKFLHQST